MKTVSKKLLSLLLVAILLVSALPFQAFADAHDPSTNPMHVLSGYSYDATGHWQVCTKTDCDDAVGGVRYFNAHTLDANGYCATCTYQCTHASQGLKDGSEVAPTCVTAGKEKDTVCLDCGKVMAEGAVVPATGLHTYGPDGKCTNCAAVQEGAPFKLTLDANGGTVNGASTIIVDVKAGNAISVLPDAYRQGYTFAGWFVGTTQLTLGQAYPFTADQTATAKWTEKTEQLTVRRVLNGDFSTAKTIYTQSVPVGTPLLNYLNANVASVVQAELALTPGFSWQYNFWKDYSGTQPLTSQADCMNQAQTVYVNFISNSYTLYFNANGGVVTPTSKTVYFGSKVGTLPTASMSGKVFQGWKDANGNMYTADTVYQVAGDTSLTAVWKDEALVILYIYINGDFSACNRMIVMDGFVKNSNLSRSDVYAQVAKYYTPAYGVLSIAGLFDEYTWSSYRANTGKAGTENIQIDSSHPNKVYVMVNNANTGSTIINGGTNNNGGTTVPPTTAPQGAYWVSTGNGNGYWVYPAPTNPNNPTYPTYIYVGSNPKTGDTAKIEIAAAIMVLAAAALVTVMTLRKKKSV